MRAIVIVLLAVAGMNSPVYTQETYPIKLKTSPDVGMSYSYKYQSKDSGVMKVMDEKGKILKETKPGGSVSELIQTTYAVNEQGKSSLFLREYSKSRTTEDEKTNTASYEKRQLLFEKLKTGKYRIGIVGENNLKNSDIDHFFSPGVRPSEKEILYGLLNSKKTALLGETWKLDVSKFEEYLDGKLDLENSSGSAKLKKVDRKGETPVGMIEIDIKLRVRSAKQDNLVLQFADPASYEMKGTVEMALDASSTECTEQMKMSMKGTASLKIGDQNLKIERDVQGNQLVSVSSESPAKDKSPPKVTLLPAPGEWIKYSPKNNSFSVEFPGTPSFEQLDEKKIKTDFWHTEIEHDTISYSVGRADLGIPDLEKDGVKTVFDAIVKNAGKPKTKEFKFHDYPGIELEMIIDGNEHFQRIIIIKGIMWHQHIASKSGVTKAEDRDRFYKSFEIKDLPKK